MDLTANSPYGKYLEHCRNGDLAFQRDADGKALFYPRAVLGAGLDEPKWEISSGTGTVYAVTVVRHRDEAPFALALVDLDEGFRMMSQVDTPDPTSVKVGARVEVGFRPLGEGQPPLPVFALTGGAA